MTQALPTQPPPGQQDDGLILSYLDHVNGLLHRYAASARLDYEDLRQDASLVIMHCLELQPHRAAELYGYVRVAVRNRIIDRIREAQRRQAASLDNPIGSPDQGGSATLADLIPSGYSVDPLLVVLAKEGLQALPTRRRKTQRVQEAMTILAEVTQ